MPARRNLPVWPEVARLRDGRPVAGWTVKANRTVWDVVAHLRSGAPVETWRLAETYRCALVAPGQPVLLWLTGADRDRPPPGVAAAGTITTAPFTDVGDPDDPLWLDRGSQRAPRPYVGVDMVVLGAVLARPELRDDPRLAAMEVLVAPRAPNPQAVTPDELDALCDHLDDRAVDALTGRRR